MMLQLEAIKVLTKSVASFAFLLVVYSSEVIVVIDERRGGHKMVALEAEKEALTVSRIRNASYAYNELR
jgi:hypothetical protein